MNRAFSPKGASPRAQRVSAPEAEREAETSED